MAGSSEPAFLFFRHKNGAVAPVDYSSTFATAPYIGPFCLHYSRNRQTRGMVILIPLQNPPDKRNKNDPCYQKDYNGVKRKQQIKTASPKQRFHHTRHLHTKDTDYTSNSIVPYSQSSYLTFYLISFTSFFFQYDALQ